MLNIDPIKKNNVTVTGNLHAESTIIFVHGFGTDQTAWEHVAKTFLAEFRLILFDNVGAGKSAAEAFAQHRYLNLLGYVNDLLDICEALQLADTILVGHSVGGMIGVLAAIEKPHFFSKLVLIGASPRYLDDENYHGGFSESDLNAVYRTMISDYKQWVDNFASQAMDNPDRPCLALYFAATIKSIPFDFALTIICSIFQSDHRAALCKLDKPTLLIQSKQDFAVPLEVAEFMQQNIKGSRLSVINAKGHLPHISAPDIVTAAIDNFIHLPLITLYYTHHILPLNFECHALHYL
jgi:sigma-B regulation protein RsbQ